MSSYWLARNGQKYGPYPLEVLQQMVSAGQTVPSDSVWQEGMPNWVPLSQVVAGSPPPAADPNVPAASAYTPGSSFTPSFGYGAGAGLSPTGPTPPSLHWGLVLLFDVLTCFLFHMVWILIQSAFVSKLERRAVPILLAVLAIVAWGCQFVFQIAAGVTSARGGREPSGLVAVLSIATWVLMLVWAFYVRGVIQQYYNTVEPIHLNLSGVMTFFFSVFYFQHHFRRIAEGKRTGNLQPQ